MNPKTTQKMPSPKKSGLQKYKEYKNKKRISSIKINKKTIKLS